MPLTFRNASTARQHQLALIVKNATDAKERAAAFNALYKDMSAYCLGYLRKYVVVGLIREDEMEGVVGIALAKAMNAWKPEKGAIHMLYKFYVSHEVRDRGDQQTWDNDIVYAQDIAGHNEFDPWDIFMPEYFECNKGADVLPDEALEIAQWWCKAVDTLSKHQLQVLWKNLQGYSVFDMRITKAELVHIWNEAQKVSVDE